MAEKTARELAQTNIAENRKAFYDYHILDTWEAGMVLLWTEAKSIREGRVNLRDSFARIERGEVWLYNVHISAYSHRGYADHEPLRQRKLLMHRAEIRKLIGKTTEKGMTIGATVGGKGIAVLLTLGKLVVLMYAGLALFVLIVVFGVSVLIRVPFLAFARAIREPFLLAFSTASSEAALPDALEVMERFGVPRNIVAFVLPTGYSFNLDGTTLYLSLASVFVAQLAGVQLTMGQQLMMMMLALMLVSKGVAGVPRGALVVLTGMLTQFGLPLEGAAILLGIDQVLDMGRTGVNVMGNCIAPVVVARWEGVFDDEKMRAFGRRKEAA